MSGLIRALVLSLYTAVTVGGAGLHLLEFTPEEGCPGCAEPKDGPSLLAECTDGPLPCSSPSHSHHTHPVHHNEDGCVTCTALASQQSVSTAPVAFVATEVTKTPPLVASHRTSPAVRRPSDRAPPAL